MLKIYIHIKLNAFNFESKNNMSKFIIHTNKQIIAHLDKYYIFE